MFRILELLGAVKAASYSTQDRNTYLHSTEG